MKLQWAIVIVGLLAISFCSSSSYSQGWQSAAGFEPLTVDSSKFLLKLAPSVDLQSSEDVLRQLESIAVVIMEPHPDYMYYVCSLIVGVDFDMVADSLLSSDMIAGVEYYYVRWPTPPRWVSTLTNSSN